MTVTLGFRECQWPVKPKTAVIDDGETASRFCVGSEQETGTVQQPPTFKIYFISL
jgi:hypothetical protein